MSEYTPTAYRVARWRHTRWFEPHLARPTDVHLRPQDGTGAHALYAGCRDCDEVLLPETFESVPLPSVEDVARAILMVTQAADVDPDYAWNVQYPEVQDELLDQARAVLALLPGRTEAEVRQDERHRLIAALRAKFGVANRAADYIARLPEGWADRG